VSRGCVPIQTNSSVIVASRRCRLQRGVPTAVRFHMQVWKSREQKYIWASGGIHAEFWLTRCPCLRQPAGVGLQGVHPVHDCSKPAHRPELLLVHALTPMEHVAVRKHVCL